MHKKVIVVGASSGIGSEIARELLKSGAYVTLVARREDELNKVVADVPASKYCTIKHNVSSFEEAGKCFNDSIKAMGGLDEIYYCAGILEKVAIDEFSTEKDIRMLSVNTLGAVAWLNPAAAYFQKMNAGKIIGISSIAGDRGRVASPAYNTSKAALNTYLEALRNRLARKGILVLTVKPGFIDTIMTKGLPGLFWVISANQAAKIIIQAAAKGKEIIYVPARWAFVGFIVRMIPSFIFKKLNI